MTLADHWPLKPACLPFHHMGRDHHHRRARDTDTGCLGPLTGSVPGHPDLSCHTPGRTRTYTTVKSLGPEPNVSTIPPRRLGGVGTTKGNASPGPVERPGTLSLGSHPVHHTQPVLSNTHRGGRIRTYDLLLPKQAPWTGLGHAPFFLPHGPGGI